MGEAAARGARDAFGLRHDPTQVLTASDVENEILRLCVKLENLTNELAGQARLAAETEANHKGRRASEFLKAEGTDSRRAAAAEVATHDLFMRRKIQEALYESTKQACRSTETQLDSLRTIAANIRAQT